MSKGKADKAKLRADFTKALREAVRDIGPEGFDRTSFAAKWIKRGVSRSTAFRWIAEDLVVAGQELAVQVNATALRAAMPHKADPVVAAAAPLPVMELIRSCIQTAEEIREAARGPDGKIRLTKTALAASEHLRRSLETAAKLHEAIRDVQQTEAMHAAIISEIEAESPELAMRVLRRLENLAAGWGPA